MEYIKEFIATYLPSISSIAAIVIAVITFLGKVKTLVSNTAKENKDLKNLLETFAEANSQYQARTASYSDDVNKAIELLKTELQETQKELTVRNEELKSIKETTKAYEDIIDELKTVKTQLRVVLDEKEN